MAFSVKGTISFEQDGRKITLYARDFGEEHVARCLTPEGHPRTEAIFIGRYSGLDGCEHEVSFRAVQEGDLVYAHKCPVFEAAVTNVENHLKVVIVVDAVGGRD